MDKRECPTCKCFAAFNYYNYIKQTKCLGFVCGGYEGYLHPTAEVHHPVDPTIHVIYNGEPRPELSAYTWL